ncbi:disulfide bond formation protein B [Pseudomonas sp. OV226]|uniref:disulfide bond formation protein B n=1 Tax=Pseudomonas sp. OV226 TaxID=2135588 RepID=UPI000D6B8BEA|nr:disulfide bond formation protein B [Pseudomonas sp. OV226]PWK43199.1 disulfide bond formation protein DsbB [Pseudomonas sp. OV226]
MSLACSRSLFFMVFITGSLALGVSYYLEYAVGLKPCGLCLLQRLCLALLTGISLAASVLGPGRFGSFLYWLSGFFCSLVGTATAWRQILRQSDPAHQLTMCSSSLESLHQNMPWVCRVTQMFKGEGDCDEISWTLFDLSIPEWSLLLFVAMTILGSYQLLRIVWLACERPLSGKSSHRVRMGD